MKINAAVTLAMSPVLGMSVIGGCCAATTTPPPLIPQGEALAIPDNSLRSGAVIVRGLENTPPQVVCPDVQILSDGLTIGPSTQFALDTRLAETTEARINATVLRVARAGGAIDSNVNVATILDNARLTPLQGVLSIERIKNKDCVDSIAAHKRNSPGIQLAYVYGMIHAVVKHSFVVNKVIGASAGTIECTGATQAAAYLSQDGGADGSGTSKAQQCDVAAAAAALASQQTLQASVGIRYTQGKSGTLESTDPVLIAIMWRPLPID